MNAFCASCTCETGDLREVEQDGRKVTLCWACDEGPLRLFTFAEPVRARGTWSASRTFGRGVVGGGRHPMGDGNYRVTGGGLSIGARGGKR